MDPYRCLSGGRCASVHVPVENGPGWGGKKSIDVMPDLVQEDITDFPDLQDAAFIDWINEEIVDRTT